MTSDLIQCPECRSKDLERYPTMREGEGPVKCTNCGWSTRGKADRKVQE